MERKTTVWIWQATNRRNLTWENLQMAKKKYVIRENLSFLNLAENNAMKTNYVQMRIYKTQHNCKCGWSGERDETINHIMTNAANRYKKSTALDMIGWGWSSIGNYARNWNLTILPNGICTIQRRFWTMRVKK